VARRVSIGVEVVKDPACILLDEPTTGLDSEMALQVVAILKAMARAGKMVSRVGECALQGPRVRSSAAQSWPVLGPLPKGADAQP
jgi:ABC-type histidine transport system ATPase subunit